MIRFEKVLCWAPPVFGDDNTLFEWQAAMMRTYMIKIMKDDTTPFKPKYYNLEAGKVITVDHVARFYGAALARMLTGSRSMDQMFCSQEWFNAVPPFQESMPLDALREMNCCLHWVDHWDEDGWDEVYNDIKQEAGEETAQHCKKFSMVEDAYNQR